MRPSFLVIVIALISLNLISALFAAIYPSGFWAVVAFLLYVVFCASLYRMRPASFLMLSPLLFLRLTEMVSGIPIEYGAYIQEISMYGSPTGGFNRLSALLIVFFTFSSSLIEPFWARVKSKFVNVSDRSTNGAGIVTVALLLALSYLVLVGIRNGFSLLDGVDRFRYRWDLGDPVVTSIINNFSLFAPILGFLALNRRRRTPCILLIIALLLVAILYSEKFTSLSLITILVLIPVGLLHVARNDHLPIGFLVYIPLAIAIFTMPLVLFVYGYAENPEFAVKKLADRMTAQGELWWVTDRDHFEMFRLESGPLIADFSTWFVPSAQNAIEVGPSFGLYMVMQPYAPADVAYVAGQQGTGYIFSLFAYLLMTTGVFGLVLVGFAAHAAYALTMVLMIRSFADNDWLRIILSTKLFIFNVSGGFIVGYLWSFFGIKSIAVIASILIIQKLHSTSFEKQRRTI